MNVLDRGGIVDEYLSVPEFYGPLPPGDVIGLAANPTVLARLTGADPAVVKEVARTAASPRNCHRRASCSRRSRRCWVSTAPPTATPRNKLAVC